MSEHLVSRSDIDALVAVGLAWGDLPEATAVRAAAFWPDLRRDPSAAGARLWRENHDCVVYGGDPDLLDEDERASLLEEYEADFGPLPPYAFDPMPGFPSARAGLRVISYYSYQTSNHWANEGPTPISVFLDALRSFGESMADAGVSSGELPWGIDDEHRDYFLRY
ncbi:hypothetical protein [Nocardioides sp. SLBN-35]|jgi:hypothetical protein|uniref:hypothetical protein n=1 Tax=Nocardioides sp. SLBN-35 TaxID=2768445 RepID=UPI00114E3C4B|nr:hypothetical protein [Nocardioides sp. SLBN-35]TQK71426.1 hypothetical protein FBY23_3219 [Nocardioides sp. SLBN-35]